MCQTNFVEQLENEILSLKTQLANVEQYRERQAILIKVLQIMQSAESLPQAMNEMLAEIGKYAGVSRVYVFEKSDDGTTINCTFDWSNTGITHIIDDFQNTPIEIVRPWFDVFDAGEIINTFDINTLNPKIVEILKRYDVKSFLDLPMTANGVHYGYVGFDECVCNREWDENEVELLRSLSHIISATRNRYQAEHHLVMERDRLKAIGNNIPNGALFRRETNTQTNEKRYTYLSDTWKDVVGLDVQRALDDFTYNMNIIIPEDRQLLLNKMSESEKTLDTYCMEIRINHPSGEIRWLQIASHPYRVGGNRIIYDGYVLDVTSRKKVELELAKYRENLEHLVKERTEELETSSEELQITSEELQATNEELQATNEELQATNEELISTNEELDKYKTQLEEMVDEKTMQIIVRQEELENLNRRQAILIKVLHIMQSNEDLKEAINKSLAEIGRYAGVSRVHVFEKSPDETTISNTFGWCNDGIDKVIDFLQNIPIEIAKSFFDMFDAGIHTCATDDRMLAPSLSEMLIRFDVKSIMVFPLSSGSDNYGFVIFDDCYTVRKWDENEVELLKSLSEIISGIRTRFQIETSLHRSHQTMQTLLNNMNAIILVTDFETLDILFANDSLRKLAGEDLEGKKCWKILQLGKNEVCEWCPKKNLLGKKCPTEVCRFEHAFDIVNKHLAIDAMAIEWIDGRKALMEVCFDITDRKQFEQQLVMERDRLKAIGDNFPGGSLLSFEINTTSKQMKLTYVGGTWENIIGVSCEDTLADISNVMTLIVPEDLQKLQSEISENISTRVHFEFELRFIYKGTETRWLQLSTYRRKEAVDKVVSDGYILDITARKTAELELEKYREGLEILVEKRTEELETINEELKTTSEELKTTNEELNKYQMHLEVIVAEKTIQLVERQKDLVKLNRRQDILIKVLQITQSAKTLEEAMNRSIAEIGQYTGVCRVYVFEKSDDESTISCTYDWSAAGIKRIIADFQNTPIEMIRPWFEIFDSNDIINTSDINTLNPKIVEILNRYGVKSFLNLPLTSNGVHYGFVGFDKCFGNSDWDENEVELLRNLSQILSVTRSRFRAEQELLDERDRLQAIGDNFPDGSLFRFEINPQNMEMSFSYVSATWEKVMGVSIKDTLTDASKVFGLILPEFVGPQMEEIKRCTLSLKHFLVEYQEWYKDQEKKWIQVSSYPHKVSEDKIVFDGFVLDITTRKEAEMDLVQAKEKAEEADKLKSAFLANMSHEIRTPLNAIVGFLNIITSEDLPRERERELFKIINNSSAQLTKLIDDIVDVAKIEANQLNILPVPTELNQLMIEMQAILETYMQTKNKSGIALIYDDSGVIDNCIINVDPVRLRQILVNLIGNAIKFTEKGYVRFGYRQSAPDKLEFVVEDTGIGMALDEYEIVFERFRKGNSFYEGVGLGLNIVHSLVQMMGGDIWLETTEGIGTTFYFTILYQPVS